MTTLAWADWWTRQEILNAVTAKFTTQDHIDVRHMLDRNAIRRQLSDEAFVRQNADFLRMDWLD